MLASHFQRRTLSQVRVCARLFPCINSPKTQHPFLVVRNFGVSVPCYDHYKTLGVDAGATLKEIKTAYIEKSKLYHPDSNPLNPKLHNKFLEVQEAYKVLSSHRQRNEYDVELENLVRGIRNETPLTEEEVAHRFGSNRFDSNSNASNFSFFLKCFLWVTGGTGAVFIGMRLVEYSYIQIIIKRRLAFVKKKRKMADQARLEEEQKKDMGEEVMKANKMNS